jgi:hypothetical protein
LLKSIFPILWRKTSKEKQMLMTTERKTDAGDEVFKHTALWLLSFIGQCVFVKLLSDK